MDRSELESQPISMLFEIALNLPYPELAKYCQLSKKFRQICTQQTFWTQKAQHDFPNFRYLNRVGIPKSHAEYRQIYLVYHCLPGAEKYTSRCLAETIRQGKLENLDYFLSNPPIDKFKTRTYGGLH